LTGAAVGVTETTGVIQQEIQSYPHPCNERLKFWDLPGVGTDRFPRHSYLSQIEVDRYDFFLLMTATRFTEIDTWLGKEIHKRNKKYFFVRTKIRDDISSNKKAHPRTHNEEAVVKDIRDSTKQLLKKNGCVDVPVFLIDNYKLTKFEFDDLEHRLVEDFPKLKKSALVLSLQATSEKMIRLKVAELRSRMWKVAALSGAVAAIPVPGLSIVFDIGLVVEEAEFYYSQLGLDKTSLRRYANVMSCDYERLRSIVDSRMGFRVIGVGSIKKLIEVLSKYGTKLVASAAMEEVARFIPAIGQVIAASLSIGGTYYSLKLILDKMESVAVEVVRAAADRAADADQ